MNLTILKSAAANTATIKGEAFEWTRYQPVTSDSIFVPLDDVLQVSVVERAHIRKAVRDYLGDHCNRRIGVLYAAGRGKLVAHLLALSESRVVFGDLVKAVKSGLQRSEYRPFRQLDPRELARTLCIPAVELH